MISHLAHLYGPFDTLCALAVVLGFLAGALGAFVSNLVVFVWRKK